MTRKQQNEPDADTAKGDVEEQMAKDQEQGFHGVKVDPIPNEAYSLESGPDSPTAQEQRDALAESEEKP